MASAPISDTSSPAVSSIHSSQSSYHFTTESLPGHNDQETPQWRNMDGEPANRSSESSLFMRSKRATQRPDVIALPSFPVKKEKDTMYRCSVCSQKPLAGQQFPPSQLEETPARIIQSSRRSRCVQSMPTNTTATWHWNTSLHTPQRDPATQSSIRNSGGGKSSKPLMDFLSPGVPPMISQHSSTMNSHSSCVGSGAQRQASFTAAESVKRKRSNVLNQAMFKELDNYLSYRSSSNGCQLNVSMDNKVRNDHPKIEGCHPHLPTSAEDGPAVYVPLSSGNPLRDITNAANNCFNRKKSTQVDNSIPPSDVHTDMPNVQAMYNRFVAGGW